MEDNELYQVKKPQITKIEDNSTYQAYSNSQIQAVPVEEMGILLKLFLDKAAVNMGKESYDAPEATKESILEFLYRDFGTLQVVYIGSAIIRGSLGKYGAGRLVPSTVYRWFNEVSLEYERNKRHEKLAKQEYNSPFDLNKYPLGSAILKIWEWRDSKRFTDEELDKIPLKVVAEKIGKGINITPEMFGL